MQNLKENAKILVSRKKFRVLARRSPHDEIDGLFLQLLHLNKEVKIRWHENKDEIRQMIWSVHQVKFIKSVCWPAHENTKNRVLCGEDTSTLAPSKLKG